MKVDFDWRHALQLINSPVPHASSSEVIFEGFYSHMLIPNSTTTFFRKEGFHLCPEFRRWL
jgi:hypothetical protein